MQNHNPVYPWHLKPWQIALGLLALLVFRIVYGMCKFGDQDEIQIYLIGLKYYTTGIFPYWGPDIVITNSQIPGGLQGLLVGLPFFVFPIPESPYFLLNILSFSALLFFAWYLSRRIPGVPKWLIYCWLLTSPWTLRFSAHIVNPSYVLFGSVLFFVSIFELFPIYEQQILPKKLAFFFIGFALMWVFQLHMSWVLLLPYIGLAFWFQRREKLISHLFFFLSGAAVGGSTLIPVFLQFGTSFSGETEQNVGFHPENILEIFTVMARFLSFASYEVVRFIGEDNPTRLAFLNRYFWAAPFTVFLIVVGFAQVLFLGYSFFRSRISPEWRSVRLFTLGTIGLVWLTFLFTVAQPASHTFYLMLPVAMWYAFYCYTELASKKQFNTWAILVLSSGLVFQATLAYESAEKFGLAKNRAKIEQAIRTKDYTVLGLRRESDFEKKHWEDLWTFEAESDTGSLCYRTDFEYKSPVFKPQNVVSHEKYSGTYSIKLDSLRSFGMNFNLASALLGQRRKAALEFYVKMDTTSALMLVTEVLENGKNVYWNGQSVTEKRTTLHAWEKVRMDLVLPEKINPNAELRIYLWQAEKTGAAIFIDQAEICFR